MASKYLVTGGTGFIGTAAVKKLLKEGHQVRCLDNQFRGDLGRISEIRNNIEMVEGDIRNPEVVRKACRGVDAVLHLAYINGTEFFYSQPELVLDVALRGMLNVLDGCRAEKVRNLILASSSEVYQTPHQIPTDESAPLVVPDPLNPRYSYGGGKIACELLALNYGLREFDRVTIFRPHNVYGPDMGWEHVLPQLTLKIVDGIQKFQSPNLPLPLSIQGDGSQSRSFIHIDDFVEGLWAVIEHGLHRNIYHIGTQEEVTMADVARRIGKILGYEIQLIPGPNPQGQTQRRCPDITKLKTLGFDPKIKLDEGLISLVTWYKEHFRSRPSRNFS